MTERYLHLAGGTWLGADARESVEIVNPATEEVVDRVPRATLADTRAAIEAARNAFDDGPWSRMTGRERRRILEQFVDGLARHKEEIAHAVVTQGGATISQARGMQVYEPIELLRGYAELAERDPVQQTSMIGGLFAGANTVQHSMALREPSGVVAAITPFNYPFFLAVQKVGPALAAGCTVVLKPTEFTCLDAYLMARVAQDETDMPPGVFNVLLGGGGDVGQELCTHPSVDHITFVGSTATGRRVMASAAETVKRVTLELGGKSANVIFADADLDQALAGDAALVLRHAGQGCSQLTRVLVEDAIHDRVVEAMSERAARVVIGDPLDEATEMGPLVSRAQYERMTGYIESGKAEGATLSVGGGRPPGLDRGYFVEPTVFTDVTPDMRIYREEIFGPVVVVTRFTDEADAVRQANSTIFGLSGGVWSGDLDRALRVAGRMRTGTVSVNGGASIDKGFPAGGYKQSGMGRDYGRWALDEYTELKTVRYRVR